MRIGTVVSAIREAPGMCELQPDEEVVGRPCAELPGMGGEQLVAQSRRSRRRSPGRASAGADWRVRRAAPRPLRRPRSAWRRSGRTRASGGCQVARPPVGRAVPPFHRQNREAVADAGAVVINGAASGEVAGRGQLASKARSMAPAARWRAKASAFLRAATRGKRSLIVRRPPWSRGRPRRRRARSGCGHAPCVRAPPDRAG